MKPCVNNVGGRSAGALSTRVRATDSVARIPNTLAAAVGERAGKPRVVPA